VKNIVNRICEKQICEKLTTRIPTVPVGIIHPSRKEGKKSKNNFVKTKTYPPSLKEG
jgi:hypothetical protein